MYYSSNITVLNVDVILFYFLGKGVSQQQLIGHVKNRNVRYKL